MCVWACVVGSDGTLFGGSEDKVIYQFEAETGVLAQAFEGHAAGVLALAVSSQGRLYSGAGDCVVMEWDIAQGKTSSLTTLRPSLSSSS